MEAREKKDMGTPNTFPCTFIPKQKRPIKNKVLVYHTEGMHAGSLITPSSLHMFTPLTNRDFQLEKVA
jgi:hypothetical protein